MCVELFLTILLMYPPISLKTTYTLELLFCTNKSSLCYGQTCIMEYMQK